MKLFLVLVVFIGQESFILDDHFPRLQMDLETCIEEMTLLAAPDAIHIPPGMNPDRGVAGCVYADTPQQAIDILIHNELGEEA